MITYNTDMPTQALSQDFAKREGAWLKLRIFCSKNATIGCRAKQTCATQAYRKRDSAGDFRGLGNFCDKLKGDEASSQLR